MFKKPSNKVVFESIKPTPENNLFLPAQDLNGNKQN